MSQHTTLSTGLKLGYCFDLPASHTVSRLTVVTRGGYCDSTLFCYTSLRVCSQTSYPPRWWRHAPLERLWHLRVSVTDSTRSWLLCPQHALRPGIQDMQIPPQDLWTWLKQKRWTIGSCTWTAERQTSQQIAFHPRRETEPDTASYISMALKQHSQAFVWALDFNRGPNQEFLIDFLWQISVLTVKMSFC